MITWKLHKKSVLLYIKMKEMGFNDSPLSLPPLKWTNLRNALTVKGMYF